MSPSKPDELSATLHAWQVDAELPGDFQRRVWQQIEARQAAREDSLWPRVQGWLTQLFARPVFALAIVLLSLSGGIVCGRAKAYEANAHTWHDLEARYEMTLNPLAREIDHLNHTTP